MLTAAQLHVRPLQYLSLLFQAKFKLDVMTSWDDKITVRQSYFAMYEFLRQYYERCPTDAVGGLLGDLSLLQDGSSSDPAVDDEFLAAAQLVIEGRSDAKLQFK